MTRQVVLGGWVLLLAALPLAPAATQPPQPAPVPATPAAEETHETRKLDLEARSAGIGEFLTRVGEALDVRLRCDPEIGQSRLTLYANETTLPQLREALAQLYSTRWRPSGRDTQTGLDSDWHLTYNESLAETSADRRADRRAQLVNRLLELRRSALGKNPATFATEVRRGLAAQRPVPPAEALEAIDADLIRDLALLQPLAGRAAEALLRDGSVWTPARGLPPAYLTMFSSFFSKDAGERLLGHPQSRIEYRLLYGDRWTGPLLLVRAGWSDRWATRVFPGTLAGLPDDAGLLPGVGTRSVEAGFRTPVDISIDTGRLTWDQAITQFGKTAKIRVLSDSYSRPMPFRPVDGGVTLRGTDIGHTLDRLTDAYGYVWWKSGDFYLFRHRLWTEEDRVAVPARLFTDLSASLARGGRLSNGDLVALSALDDEKLLSLRLYGSSEGMPSAPLDAFDFNELQLTRAGLTLFGQFNDHLRELARAEGAPLRLMTAEQRRTFEAVARDRGLRIEAGDSDGAVFRVRERFTREKGASGWVEHGGIRLEFALGDGITRWTFLSLRLPAAPPRTPAPEPAAP